MPRTSISGTLPVCFPSPATPCQAYLSPFPALTTFLPLPVTPGPVCLLPLYPNCPTLPPFPVIPGPVCLPPLYPNCPTLPVCPLHPPYRPHLYPALLVSPIFTLHCPPLPCHATTPSLSSPGHIIPSLPLPCSTLSRHPIPSSPCHSLIEHYTALAATGSIVNTLAMINNINISGLSVLWFMG